MKVVEIAPFTFADLMDVVAAQRESDARYADLTLVLALTGVRFGELSGLRVKDVAEVPHPRWSCVGHQRHTAASLWIAAGVDIKTVSSWLGHSTANLTLDVYGHLMGTDADRARSAA